MGSGQGEVMGIDAVSRAEFLADVLEGLSRPQKAIPGKYLWDETGSGIFDRICESRDYYLTRRETSLLQAKAPDVARIVGPGASPGLFGSEPELLMRARFAGRDRRRAWAVEGHTLILEAAMVPFAGLLAALQQIPDPRRRQGQRYSLAHLLLFAVLAMLAGATSYRGMRAFIAVHREHLNATFGARFRRAPAVNTLRGLFQALDPAELEAAFRRHAQSLDAAASPAGSRRVIALDGKTLKRSFDHLNDVTAAHVLSAFACEAALILAHQEVHNAAEEVPAVQALIEELGVRGVLFTADALHGQKKLRGRGAHRQRPVGPAQVQPAPLA
jgi:hypothetical protein